MDSSRYFGIGMFVLTGVVLLFGGIVAFGAGSFFKTSIHAETYVDEPVTGLDVGSTVRYRGVPVGKVKAIRLAANKYPQADGEKSVTEREIVIEMSLDLDLMPRFGESALARAVAAGLRAKIMQSGITGTAYLGLDFFDPKASPPAPISWSPEGVYVPSVPSTSTQLFSAVEHLSSQLEKVDLPALANHLDSLLTGANKAISDLKSDQIREQAIALLAEVRSTNGRIQRMLDDPHVAEVVRDLPQIAGHLKGSLARLDEIMHDKRIDQTLTGVAVAANNAGPLTTDMRRMMHDLREIVATEQDDLRAAIADLRTVADNLNAVTQDAKRNPARLLFGQPPARRNPGE